MGRPLKPPLLSHFFRPGFCAKADPAAVFEVAEVLLLRRTFDAAFAAVVLVTLLRFDLVIGDVPQLSTSPRVLMGTLSWTRRTAIDPAVGFGSLNRIDL